MNTSYLRIAIIDPVGMKAGMDDYDRSLALGLRQLSGKVKVYSNFAVPGHSEVFEEHFKFTFKKRLLERLIFVLHYISALRKSKRENVGLVILHLFHSSFVDYLMIYLTKLFGFRICLIVHDPESFIHTNKKSWLKQCIRTSDAGIVHNRTTFEILKNKIGSKELEKIHIVPHGNFMNHPAITGRVTVCEYFKLNPEKKYLLFFGMLKKSKGLNVLLQAMSGVDQHAHLIIAGRERDTTVADFESEISALNLRERILFLGRYISNEERHYLFSLADVVVLPYLQIYQSGVLLLAMSYGIPVLASDLPANKEIINGNNGKLFTSGDSTDLSAKINLLIKDVKERGNLSKNAIDYSIKNHDWSDVARRFLDIINTIQ